jgi:hypothetical protein
LTELFDQSAPAGPDTLATRLPDREIAETAMRVLRNRNDWQAVGVIAGLLAIEAAVRERCAP